MATFQPIQPRAKETIETESNDDDDDPPQGSNSKDIMHDDSFGSPGFMQYVIIISFSKFLIQEMCPKRCDCYINQTEILVVKDKRVK